MLNVPNLLVLSQQIGTAPTQLPRVFSPKCRFSFMFSYWWSLFPAVCLSEYITFLLLSFLSPSIWLPSIKSMFICLSFLRRPSSAPSYCRSGERGSQSGENALVGVCVSWWKPPSDSPLDKGKFCAPSVKETSQHWRAILVEELVNSFCASLTAPYGTTQLYF